MNEIEAIYEESNTDVGVERVSTLTFTRDSSHITSFVFTHINFTRVRTLELLLFIPYIGLSSLFSSSVQEAEEGLNCFLIVRFYLKCL